LTGHIRACPSSIELANPFSSAHMALVAGICNLASDRVVTFYRG